MTTKKARENYQTLSKEEKEKSDYKVVSDTKNQKIKNNFLNVGKNIIKWNIHLILTLRNYFYLEILLVSKGWTSCIG